MSNALLRPREIVPLVTAPPPALAAAPRPSTQFTLNVAVVVVVALYIGRDVLMPLTLAVLLSILLAPLVGLLRRLRLGRVPSVLAAVLIAVAVIFGVGGVIGSQIANLATDVPKYARTIEHKTGLVRRYAARQINRAAHSIGYEPGTPAPQPVVQPPARSSVQPGLSTGPIGETPKPLTVELRQPDPSPLELAERYLSPVLSPMGTIGIVFVVSIFILLQQEDLKNRLIRLFGSNDLRRTTVALDDGGRRLSRYFITQLGINTSFGTIIGIGLFLIGVPSPLLWGVLAGLLRFLPYIGAFIAAFFPMALAAAVGPGWSMIVWTGVLFAGVEAFVGQAVEPLVYGRGTGLSPISVIVSAIFWSWLWGPVGLILSTPLSLCLLVLGRHVDRLEFLDVILGDRPALSPVQSFYQRLLAADADEAHYHAEQMLKERPLTSFYDEVALPGLEMAAVDAQRGLLTQQQLERVKESITELVAELGSPDEKTLPESRVDDDNLAPAWRTDSPVLCVAGRGPLDEAASVMLCQLLQKHGIGARIAPYEAATRGNINLLDVEGVAMVCVSYLDITGKQAHLRYLLRRLRQRVPHLPIVVGLWPAEEPSLRTARANGDLNADIYASTLADAVNACLKAATARRA